jgi:hypothetical protein
MPRFTFGALVAALVRIPGVSRLAFATRLAAEMPALIVTPIHLPTGSVLGEDGLENKVVDNGIGLPTMKKAGRLSQLGSQLIETLVTQIRGTQQSVVEEGLTTTIIIPAKVSV